MCQRMLRPIQQAILTLYLLLLGHSVIAAPLRIYIIDVEQGAATLLVSPTGKSLLVDSGKNGHGERLKHSMDIAGVTALDYFVCTHYHEDHYGGIDELVNDFHVQVFQSYDRGDKGFLPSSKKNEATYKDYQSTVGEDAVALTRGKTIPFDPELEVKCISSGGVVIGESNPTTGTEENDMSVSLLITYHGFKYFVGGDIMNQTENKIASHDLVQDVDVYQADHHGAETSSTSQFMNDLKPRVIVISNGNHGTYKHPRQSVLDFYTTLPGPPAVYQTNKYLKGGAGGNVPDNFIADPQTNDDDGTILLTVSANGSYQVSYRGISGDSYSTKAPVTIPLPGPIASGLVIESLLPNPAGSDEELEEITLHNKLQHSLSLVGWRLRDKSDFEWDISTESAVGANSSLTIRRNNRKMSLNNAGDEIRLVNASGITVDAFTYQPTGEGTRINTGH